MLLVHHSIFIIKVPTHMRMKIEFCMQLQSLLDTNIIIQVDGLEKYARFSRNEIYMTQLLPLHPSVTIIIMIRQQKKEQELGWSGTTPPYPLFQYPHTIGQKWKNSAIRNCWVSVRGAIKFHTFGPSVERSEGLVPKECNFILVLYFIAYLQSNF